MVHACKISEYSPLPRFYSANHVGFVEEKFNLVDINPPVVPERYNYQYNQLSFVYGSSQQSEYLHQYFGIMFVDTTN